MTYPIPDDKRVLFPISPFRPSVVWQVGVPDNSAPVWAFAMARGVPYTLPFLVVHRRGAWFNATTGDALQVKIEGWREQ